jgi:hypothetical protein
VPVSHLDEIERWFVARGLPHFVERHDSPARIWARALPLLVVAYLLLGLNALDLRDWSPCKTSPSRRSSSPSCSSRG